MRKSVVIVYDPVLEWCLRRDCQIINYFDQQEQVFDFECTIDHDQKTSS